MNVRVEKKNRFSTFSNTPINDPNLSALALGVFMYVMSKPDQWKAHKNEIYKRFAGAKKIKTSKNAIDNAFTELKQAGYIKISPIKAKNGLFKGQEYVFSEDPIFLQDNQEEGNAQRSAYNLRSTDNCPSTEYFPSSEENGGSEILAHIVNTDSLVNTDIKLIKTEYSLPQKENSINSEPNLSKPKNQTAEKEEKSCAKKEEKPKGQPATEAKYYSIVIEVLNYLSSKTGQEFKIPKSKSKIERYGSYKIIKNVALRGFVLSDFKNVIDVKYNEWWEDRKMRLYIRPETLFNENKFETYLNQYKIQQKAPIRDKNNKANIIADSYEDEEAVRRSF